MATNTNINAFYNVALVVWKVGENVSPKPKTYTFGVEETPVHSNVTVLLPKLQRYFNSFTALLYQNVIKFSRMKYHNVDRPMV